MEKTIIAEGINEERAGYAVVAFLSPAFQEKVRELTRSLSADFPGILWVPPMDALHITLFEIVMPLRDYATDKDELYLQRANQLDQALTKIFFDIKPITLNFSKLEASPHAITIQGTDEGQFEQIRNQIVQSNLLPSETRTPPDIIHSSIARFLQAVDLSELQEKLADYSFCHQELVTEFHLVKNIKSPLLGYETIKVYPLQP